MTQLYGAPPPDQRTDRQPPNGASYVDPLDGDDGHGDGSMRQPWQTLQYAHAHSPTGHLVMREGRYHQTLYQVWEKPLYLAAAPGEHAQMVGASRRTDWTYSPGAHAWWIPFAARDHTPNAPDLNDVIPWATWQEQVWFEDDPLIMSGSGDTPGSGQFSVTQTRIWIADDPADHEVEVSDLSVAVMGQLAGTLPRIDLYGFDVRRYATASMDRAAVTLGSPTSMARHMVIDGCSAAGISCRDEHQWVVGCDLTRCGQLGGHGYQAHDLVVGGCRIEGNNRKGISRITEAGGWKITASQRARWHQVLLAGNRGHGLWADEGSHETVWDRIVIESGEASGCFAELSDRCLITGCRADGDLIGFMASASNELELSHNTTTSTNGWLIRDDDPRRPGTGGHTIVGNFHDAGPTQSAEVPSSRAATTLGLTDAEAQVPRLGWYGPVHQDPPIDPPPEEPPTVPTVPELVNAINLDVTALANHTIQAEADRDVALAQLSTVQAQLAGAQAQVATLTTQLAAEQARSLQFATDLMKEAMAHNATKQLLAQAQAQVTALTIEQTALQAQVAQLQADLAACQAQPHRLIVGGSDKLGWPDLKTRLTGVLPGSFTQFVSQARFNTADLDKLAAVVADGAVPSLSFLVGTQADVDYNIGQLVARGLDTAFGGWSIGNEPTQKATSAADWRAINQYAASHLPPSWVLVAGPFQRVDVMAGPADPRYIGNWIGADASWIGALGINVYDKNQSAGSTFEQLVLATDVGSAHSVESYARSIGKKLWIREAGAPEQGTWNRPAGWKPAWYRAMLSYCLGKPDLYQLANVFNSDVGGDPPPEGWWAWTSPAALAAYREIIQASNSLA